MPPRWGEVAEVVRLSEDVFTSPPAMLALAGGAGDLGAAAAEAAAADSAARALYLSTLCFTCQR